ncbi:3'(2'),5'-bisphosphate nucleotidase CysQ [Nitrincola alkalilacustris]|uniref:3'(2'),5'-bisphosphate nucleotidase CysQ n=1 Tax=Nitrincola alkalilacustris TaxID=1571224 RepID=UPI00124E9C57|nr:3'(2'),5'-bisphosphate nucleotidase CysQ [Nitrincola alkalilacustris]
MTITPELTQSLLQLSEQAGEAILEIYHDVDRWQENTKSDDSPVTAADIAAHHLLLQGLQRITPDIPILSEESAEIPWSIRQSWGRYWLLDPLDGTREFLQRNDEFTVNLALIEQGKPIFGIVYAPVSKHLYWGGDGKAWQRVADHTSRIHTRTAGRKITLLTSRRHGKAEAEAFADKLASCCDEVDTLAYGSSIKLCLIAAGEADLYPRLAPTSEWDTGAGQAILEAAGGALYNLDTHNILHYNCKESLLNPPFVACGDPELLQLLLEKSTTLESH